MNPISPQYSTMRRGYLGLWAILVITFAVMLFASQHDSIALASYQLKTSSLWNEIFGTPEGMADEATSSLTTEEILALSQSQVKEVETDTLPKRILFIGDSMLEGLYPRLAAYAKANGHSLYCVIWYSSTSKVWGESTRIPQFIKQFEPDYVFISLGANELFVKDIEKQRDKYVKKIISEIDPIPYVWIGPPNWKEDTGINHLIATNAAPGTFFLSNGMHFDRSSDGAHPTRASAALWMDSVARWMPLHCAHPIKMETPNEQSARANRVVVLQPTDK